MICAGRKNDRGKAEEIHYWQFHCRGLAVSVASSEIGVVSVKVCFAGTRDLLAELKASEPGARFIEAVQPNKSLVTALMEYFNGENPSLEQRWDIHASAFTRRVWERASTIPYGETRSYKDVGSMAGNPKAARAVGQALHKNPLLILIPCHRVVAVNGLGGFGSGIDLKRYLLNLEKR